VFKQKHDNLKKQIKNEEVNSIKVIYYNNLLLDGEKQKSNEQ
jgi:hypothetical protein